MPAVSMNLMGPSSVSTIVSIVSRVVPGMSWTTARSSPISRLNRVDLPTFGRPTSATENTPSLGSASLFVVGRRPRACPPTDARLGRGQQLDESVEHVAGAAAVEGADAACGSPSPRDSASQMRRLAADVVDLVHDQQHGAGGQLAHDLGDAGVLLGDARDGVEDQEHGVGLGGWPARSGG